MEYKRLLQRYSVKFYQLADEIHKENRRRLAEELVTLTLILTPNPNP